MDFSLHCHNMTSCKNIQREKPFNFSKIIGYEDKSKSVSLFSPFLEVFRNSPSHFLSIPYVFKTILDIPNTFCIALEVQQQTLHSGTFVFHFPVSFPICMHIKVADPPSNATKDNVTISVRLWTKLIYGRLCGSALSDCLGHHSCN